MSFIFSILRIEPFEVLQNLVTFTSLLHREKFAFCHPCGECFRIIVRKCQNLRVAASPASPCGKGLKGKNNWKEILYLGLIDV